MRRVEIWESGRDALMKTCSRLSSALAVAIGVLVASMAGQASAYTDQIGLNYGYTSINESSTWGDALPLFGQPAVSGDELVFTPVGFSASAAGDFGFDATGAQLQLQIAGLTAADIIEQVILTEFGTIELNGVGGATTGGQVVAGGSVTVTATTSGPIAPVNIPINMVFTPSDLWGLPGDSGTSNWIAHAVIDIASVVPNALVVQVSWDNDLYASSETGTDATLVKTGALINIPEPGTSTLVASGLFLMGLVGRGRRP
jgi:hypothetical protein